MDLIDRQAALDALWKEPSYSDPLNVLAEARDRIKELPFAQPELTDEEKRLVKKLRLYHNGSYAKVIDKLLAVASAQPERTGKWIETVKHYKDDEQEYDYIEENCSECGVRRKIGWRDARCCPNCGVKIEGVTVRLEQEVEDEAD